MPLKFTRRSASIAGLVMAAAVLCASCGGGGGNASGDDVVGGGTGTGAGLTGTLWFYESLNNGTLTAPADASAATTFLTSDSEPIPWPDGSQYMEYQLTGGDEDRLVVKETSSGRTLHDVGILNFSGRLRPSPVDKNMVLTQYFESFTTETGEFWVIDLGTNTVVHYEEDNPKRYKYRWLPDGRYLRVHDETGEISTASVGGAWQKIGQVSVPANRKVSSIEVSPAGNRLAMVFWEYDDYAGDDPGDHADVWVSNLDGSQTERVTANDYTFTVFWSPDGKYLAFDNETSSCSGSQVCQGSLTWWYAPETARNVDVVPDVANAQATQFKRRYESGNTTPLAGVSIRAWLP